MIEIFTKKLNRPLLERNLKQAEVPDVCTVIQNKRGTAPGMWFEKDNKIFVSMPGVPFEMKGMMADYVIPALTKKFDVSAVEHRTLLTAGIGESFLAESIQSFETNLPENIKLAYLPSYGMVRLRLTGKSDDAASLNSQLDNLFELLKEQVKEHGRKDTMTNSSFFSSIADSNNNIAEELKERTNVMRSTMSMIRDQNRVTNLFQMIEMHRKIGNNTKADELMIEAERLIMIDQSGEKNDKDDGGGKMSAKEAEKEAKNDSMELSEYEKRFCADVFNAVFPDMEKSFPSEPKYNELSYEQKQFLRDLTPSCISDEPLDIEMVKENCVEVGMPWYYIETFMQKIRAEVVLQCGVSPSASPQSLSAAMTTNKSGHGVTMEEDVVEEEDIVEDMVPV